MQDDLTSEDYWAAGFLEGEGSFYVSKTGRVCISCPQKEREPLERLQAVIGGRIYSFTQKGGTYFRLQIHGTALCEPLLRKFRPLMSSRRQGQIDKCLANMVWTDPANRGRKNREKTHCPQGHPYDTFTVEKAGPHRRCSICIKASDERRYEARKAAQREKYHTDPEYRQRMIEDSRRRRRAS